MYDKTEYQLGVSLGDGEASHISRTEQFGSVMHVTNLVHAMQHMKQLRLALDGTRHEESH